MISVEAVSDTVLLLLHGGSTGLQVVFSFTCAEGAAWGFFVTLDVCDVCICTLGVDYMVTVVTLHIGLLSLLVPLSRLSCCCYHQQKYTHAHTHLHTHTQIHRHFCPVSGSDLNKPTLITRILLIVIWFVICPHCPLSVSAVDTNGELCGHTNMHRHAHTHTDRESGQCADLS